MIFTDATELLANSLFHIAFAAISAAVIVPFCISLPSMVLSCILSQESQCRNTFVPQTVIRADESKPGTSNLLSLHHVGCRKLRLPSVDGVIFQVSPDLTRFK